MSNRRLLSFYTLVLVCLFAVRLLKGDPLLDAASFAFGWSIATTAVFALSGLLRRRRGETCALCDDLPAHPEG
jgi:hypothetical protein